MKQILLILALLWLSACGYHLQGSFDLPEGLKNIYIQGASAQLRSSLKKSLRSADALLLDQPENADVVIKVVNEKMSRRVLSLNERGRSNEYELYYVLDFLLLDAKGKVLTATQPIEITRDYFNDQEALLGKNNEEQVIRGEIYRQAVKAVLTRSRIALEKAAQE